MAELNNRILTAKSVSLHERPKRHRVVIIGGGFGGLYAAKALSNEAVEVALIDRQNHHTFQPLLYQVALALLLPGEMASPLRHLLRKSRNVQSILAEVTGFNTAARRGQLNDGAELAYDYLIVAAGARHAYFGHDEWAGDAPGLRAIEDAVEMCRRLLLAFETAGREAYLTGRRAPLTLSCILPRHRYAMLSNSGVPSSWPRQCQRSSSDTAIP